MTTTTDDLIAEMVTLLTGATGAGANVFTPRTWPVTPSLMPMLLIQSPSEVKESEGRAAAQFTTTATVQVAAKVSSLTVSDAAAAAVQAALGTLQRQIEVAVINATPLMVLIQQIAALRCVTKIISTAERHLGELTMEFDLEFYQGPEDFAVNPADPLEELFIYGDLVNVFDPNATYPNPPFPASVNPAPRTAGPDGRTEVGADITLPQ